MMNIIKYVSVSFLICCLTLFANSSFSQINQITSNIWEGVASYYHPKFQGRKTSNGEIFSNEKLTCANNFLALGTKILVTNIKNGKSIIVKVNDRMHHRNKRLVDLSQAAASAIGLIQQGLGQVQIELIGADQEGVAQH
jgi:rare lipoprotein A